MRPADFELLADLVKANSGLVLTPDKAYLLEVRLTPVARKYSLDTLDELVEQLRRRRDEALVREIVEAMTTNESFFFRDGKPFDLAREVMFPALLKARAKSRRLRIWSAAAASGQEAYSLALLLREREAETAGWTIDIIGTDLSSEMVARARQGFYSRFEVQRGLPARLLVKYFKQAGEGWQITEEIRRMVQFRRFNLLHDLSALGGFDIVFCRNVLIYFDVPTRAKVLNAIAAQMPPDGFLALGGAETILGVTGRFRPVPGQASLYAPAPPQAVAIAGG